MIQPKLMASRRGVTLVELLVALLIISVIMTGVFNLLGASWRSYTNIVWQNRINNEARRALDDICDTVRSGGNEQDMMHDSGSWRSVPNINTSEGDSNATQLLFSTLYGFNLSAAYSLYNGNLTRYDDSRKLVANYITDVHFSYEYRNPAQADSEWLFARTDTPGNGNSADYTVRTVLITVTASYRPYPDMPAYTRTLTGAVALRKPYNTVLPFSQQNGPN